MRVYTSNMKFIWNLAWTIGIYNFICNDYVDDRPNDSIELLEKILFLIQIESIKKDKSPFIKYKIYIYNRKIRIPYMSDLLRVFPIADVGLNMWYILSKLKIDIERYNHYVQWSEEKIDEKIESIFRGERLPKKYFTYGVYKNRWFRRCARLTLRIANYKIRTLIMGLIGIFCCTPLLAIIFSILVEYIIRVNLIMSDKVLQLTILSLYSGIIYSIWICLWCRPTKFEIKNGYLDEYKNVDMDIN